MDAESALRPLRHSRFQSAGILWYNQRRCRCKRNADSNRVPVLIRESVTSERHDWPSIKC